MNVSSTRPADLSAGLHERFGLYDPAAEKSSCGVGFITRKDGVQTHEVIRLGHEALCSVPHRGGMSSEGVGDGGGVSVDLSVAFFSRLVAEASGEPGRALSAGSFGVGNFFMPRDSTRQADARALVSSSLEAEGLRILLEREVPVDDSVLRPAAIGYQLPVRQWVFEPASATPASGVDAADFDARIYRALLAIEAVAFTDDVVAGLYPVSLSSRTQVLKGRLNSNEVLTYFRDLTDPTHAVHTLYFHTRFSTNTDPHPTMAQPFRLMAHNGELNTDRKNRLSENALARSRDRVIVRPHGQSDSSRLDQTINSRIEDDGLDLVTAIVSMMPPAWENDETLSAPVRAMLEYYSLFEEKNDGPAAVVFGNGDVVGARLDRLGLRPLRSVETDEYLCVMSEAGQIAFAPATVIRRGRIEAGGMLHYDHRAKRSFTTDETLEMLAAREDYAAMVDAARVTIDALDASGPDESGSPLRYDGDLRTHQRYVAYSLNQESFRFLMDPMLQSGAERISAMGYGNAINALSDQEGGVAKYFAQRFAQVTNPPLDSIREKDGMTLRVALGAKPTSGAPHARQIVVPSPLLTHLDMIRLREQDETPLRRFPILYTPVADRTANADALRAAIDGLADDVVEFAAETGGIAVLSDRHVATDRAAIPLIVVVAAVNQRLIDEGVRFRVSLVAESGQISSSHHVAATLGFGASAVYPLAVRLRAEEKFGTEADAAFARFAKAAEKSLMKTMGRVGLCTAESYIGGEFFEPSYLDTADPTLARWFPHLDSPVGGVGFAAISAAVADWHTTSLRVENENDIPLLGLFKERSEGAGHSFGTAAVRGFVDLTEEKLSFAAADEKPSATDPLRTLTLRRLDDSFGLDDESYRNTSFGFLSEAAIDRFEPTPGYRAFIDSMSAERDRRPAALRDVLGLPLDVTLSTTPEEFHSELARVSSSGNSSILVRGLDAVSRGTDEFVLTLTGTTDALGRSAALGEALVRLFDGDVLGHWVESGSLAVRAAGRAHDYLSILGAAPEPIALDEVQPASEITRTLASGAMSHGALVATAHEAVAHGTNMVGGMSNSGEGGEHYSRYGTIRGSKIKQFASGRFGIWAGYLADPMLEEIEIKIGQGAKPGEGGQLPAAKVTVDIAAARGGTPGVELVSPPPHHDTYSIEDLAQLIHDAKAARVRVIVKLVSSEGIGTIAVGVAKAGADVINVAGNTGGTGAAAVTSLKYAGRSAEIGIAEVHQALSAHGLRQKVTLRCSGAHQTSSDVVVSALLGGDSFEFGTTALMMLKCVMAKNCNVKCPAGLTTNPEVFDGDPRALAQYLLNIAHGTREILAGLGLTSLREARGRTDLLHLVDHPATVARLDVRAMLAPVAERVIAEPVYLEKDYRLDDGFITRVRAELLAGATRIDLGDGVVLGNGDKSVGAQLAIDIERMLNHELPAETLRSLPSVVEDDRGRFRLDARTVRISTSGSAGQSYGAFCNDGIELVHIGTGNDGVGKSASGGTIIVRSPGGGSTEPGGNVLVGNFALFGAAGGRTFIEGQAGDRFAVRNSGATAVVEGVGDFACEYMTNGAVLNLGDFGTGFGNGMSGGFVYQYDPEGVLPERASIDSIVLGRIDDGSNEARVHSDAIVQMLQWHLEATGSALAERILADWENTRHSFVFGLPRALLAYQDADEILAQKTRKELVDEVAAASAAHQLRRYKVGYRDGTAVIGGRVPGSPGGPAADSDEMFALLNTATVLRIAREVAASRVPATAGASAPDGVAVAKATRNLLLTEDFLVVQRIGRYAKEALDGYSDAALAALVANKRLGDYKEALAQRNVRSIDAPGTYGWILHQDAKNRAELGRMPSFEELFAARSIRDTALATTKGAHA